MKGRETLSRSHNNFNTTDGNKGLTEGFLVSMSCGMCVWELKNFVLEISFDF
jgi:hypothetical protein